ncbi:MAG: ATP synthase F1 subunit gamma [Anaerolineaceae bacterium 4572_32.1]|nr:MAG: ATP synthase F1 subunit gamma [Anaerolineaceae bacterium 4572_32.1]
MATVREIRRRIKSVKNIAQVTRAMQAVSASRMRRAQEAVLATRPYAQRAWMLLMHLAAQRVEQEEMHPLLQARPVTKVALLLLTSDRGLCGAFNANIIRLALEYIQALPVEADVVTVGRKGRNTMLRRGQSLVAEFSDLPAQPVLADVTPIARVALDGFRDGTYDAVWLAYTDFINTLRQVPVIKRLLPLTPTEMEKQALAEYVEDTAPETVEVPEYIYEPDPRTILDTVLPRFTELQVYQAVLESIASEHSARMVAMRNATDNAESLTQDLQLTYNKARQRAITREIVDIAGGAEALAQARAAG